MKWLKQLGILLIFIVIVTVVLSMVLPTNQKIERTVTINAPASVVYEQISKLENFNKIAIWAGRDSTTIHKVSGTDGTTGASQTWKGDPKISGEGKITIESLEPGKKVKHAIQFTSPKKNNAESVITLNESGGSTTVTWEFTLSTPRPWNIFNLLHSIDEEMGADFDEGLMTLKKSLEKTNTASAAVNTPEVEQMNFPATTFVVVRQIVKWDDVPNFLTVHWDLLGRETNDTISKKHVSLVYQRDDKSRESDIAAAIETPAGTSTENTIIQVIDIPASKAVFIDYKGAISNTIEVYHLIRKYLSDNDLKQTGPIIEQYFADRSKVIFLVE